MSTKSKKLLMVALFGGFILAFIVMVWPSVSTSTHVSNGKGKPIGSLHR